MPAVTSLSRGVDAVTFYDHWSPAFLNLCDDTFQSGLPLPPDGPETASRSAVWMAGQAGIEPGHRVLDLGCGIGGPARAIAAAFETVQIEGVTISPVQTRLGNLLTAEAGFSDRVRIHLADFHRLPFRDAWFDRAVFFEVTGYSDDLPRLYAETARVLQHGGAVYIKDVFRRPGQINREQAEDLDDFNRMWHVADTHSMLETVDALSHAGFVDVESGAFERVGTDRFVGSMFTIRGSGLEPNLLGRHFLRSYRDLPVEFGWARGRRA
ncbi:MAG TPA: methyltransferase domain-containing protein [Acidimicrobiia bacterium]|nr:methyltransferase domain-containing protein [Acidimicrobiia bacterium]